MTRVLYMDALALSSSVDEFGSWVAAYVVNRCCCLEVNK
jgi:hypothetical protein